MRDIHVFGGHLYSEKLLFKNSIFPLSKTVNSKFWMRISQDLRWGWASLSSSSLATTAFSIQAVLVSDLSNKYTREFGFFFVHNFGFFSHPVHLFIHFVRKKKGKRIRIGAKAKGTLQNFVCS